MKIDVTGVPKEAMLLNLAQEITGDYEPMKMFWLEDILRHYKEKLWQEPHLTKEDIPRIYVELTNVWNDIVLKISDMLQIKLTDNELECTKPGRHTETVIKCIDKVKKQFPRTAEHPPFATKTLKEQILCWCFFYDPDHFDCQRLAYPAGELVFRSGVINAIFTRSGKDRPSVFAEFTAGYFLTKATSHSKNESILIQQTFGRKPVAFQDTLASNNQRVLSLGRSFTFYFRPLKPIQNEEPPTPYIMPLD